MSTQPAPEGAPPEPEKAKHPGGRPTKYEPRFCEEVEDLMAQGYSLGAFAGHVGVARSTINEWIDNHPEFSEAVSRAKAKRLLMWEGIGLKVAQYGGSGGQATMTIFGLKNMGEDEWRDKQEFEHSGGAELSVAYITSPAPGAAVPPAAEDYETD